MQRLGIWILAGLAVVVLMWWVFGDTTKLASTSDAIVETDHQASDDASNSADEIKPEPFPESSANIETTGASVIQPLFETDRQLKIGPLGAGKYLTSSRIAELGLPEQNLSMVRYWADIQLDYLMSGGPPPDGIPSIDMPRYVTTSEADAWLPDEQLVVGIERNGVVRAYPIAILNWHEIVNDVIDGETIIVTYCPLCNSSIAFEAPELDGKIATFGTSGRLYLSDLVMYDRVTGTFWSQLEGKPIVGPMVGIVKELKRIAIDVMPYGFWKEDHPDTVVLDRPKSGDMMGTQIAQRGSGAEGLLRDYSRDPYAQYRITNPGRGESTMFGIPINDDRLKAKDSIVGILLNEQAKAFAHDAVLAEKIINDSIGDTAIVLAATSGEKIRIFNRTIPGTTTTLEFASVDDNGLTDTDGNRWNLDGVAQSGPHQGKQLEELVGIVAFWFSWITFNPDTELYL
jgi:hypothetical protein